MGEENNKKYILDNHIRYQEVSNDEVESNDFLKNKRETKIPNYNNIYLHLRKVTRKMSMIGLTYPNEDILIIRLLEIIQNKSGTLNRTANARIRIMSYFITTMKYDQLTGTIDCNEPCSDFENFNSENTVITPNSSIITHNNIISIPLKKTSATLLRKKNIPNITTSSPITPLKTNNTSVMIPSNNIQNSQLPLLSCSKDNYQIPNIVSSSPESNNTYALKNNHKNTMSLTEIYGDHKLININNRVKSSPISTFLKIAMSSYEKKS